VSDFSGWNLKRLYNKRGGDSGDYLVLAFELSNRKSVAYLGDIELLDDFRGEE
jgi:hypothetical protein